MRVEVQYTFPTTADDIVEISEKEITDAILKHAKFYDMSREEAIEFVAGEKIFDKTLYECDDIEVDYARILE